MQMMGQKMSVEPTSNSEMPYHVLNLVSPIPNEAFN